MRRKTTCWVILLATPVAASLLVGCEKQFNPTKEQVAQLLDTSYAQAQKSRETARPSLQQGLLRNAPLMSGLMKVSTVQDTAVDSLGRIGEAAVPQLIQLLSHSDPVMRADATRALAMMGPKAVAAVPALSGSLRDPAESVRRGAARALGQVGPAAKDAIPALVQVIQEEPSPSDAKAAQPSYSAPATR